jgi:hypothetical protein
MNSNPRVSEDIPDGVNRSSADFQSDLLQQEQQIEVCERLMSGTHFCVFLFAGD